MKKRKQILRYILLSFVAIFFIVGLSLSLILEPTIKINGFIEMDSGILKNLDSKIVFTDNNGNLSIDNNNIKGTNYLSYSEIPKTLINAFIAIEDKRFFSHHGVDYKRMAGAMLSNLKQRKFAEGASTITQQLVKNTHLSSEKTIRRKIQEIRIAKEIERNYSKEKILEMYLNMLYFGNNVYGVANAAMEYFGCTVDDLSVAQCATLAAIINNPAKYNPFTHKDNLFERKNIVLKKMKELNYLTEDEYRIGLAEIPKIYSESMINNHIYDFAYKQAKDIIGNKKDFLSYSIETTFNSVYQEKIEKILNDAAPNKNILAQALLLENSTGKVLAYAASGKYDYTEFKRQLGSTIKPIICYAPCLEKKLIFPCTPILDEPVTFEDNFSPKNYKENYMGWISARKALIHSSNVCAAKLLEMGNISYCKKFAENAGLKFDTKDNSLVLALGATQRGNLLTEICNAYQMLGNGGIYIPCSFVNSIRNSKGEVIYKYKPQSKKIMDSGNAYLLNDMLIDCVQDGTAKQLKSCKYAVAAKTGTVGNKEGNTDAYCITYGKEYTLAVWFGAAEGKMENQISGGSLPTVTAREILNTLQLDMKEFPIPDNIVKLYIDKHEYEVNHKVILSNGLIPKRELILCPFNKNNIPKQRSIRYVSEYILNMPKLNFQNFHVA